MLFVEARIIAENAGEAQTQVIEALKGIRGMPHRCDGVAISIWAGVIRFSTRDYLLEEIPQIRPRLQKCPGLDPESIRIVEMVQINH
jgi:hypothetical protein